MAIIIIVVFVIGVILIMTVSISELLFADQLGVVRDGDNNNISIRTLIQRGASSSQPRLIILLVQYYHHLTSLAP